MQYDVNQKQEGGQSNLKGLNAEIQIVEKGLVDRALRTQQNLVLMVGIKSCKLSSDTNVRGTKLPLVQSFAVFFISSSLVCFSCRVGRSVRL